MRPVVTTEALDEPLTVRDMLQLVGLVRDTKPRDGLRAVEDALLDLVGKVSG